MTDFLDQLGADLDAAYDRRKARRTLPALRAAAVLGILAAAVAGIALAGTDQRTAAPNEATVEQPRAHETLVTQSKGCAIGERPGYYVPGGPPNRPLALLGCARLPVSGERVEFSAETTSINGSDELCINLAFGDQWFVRTVCKLAPSAPRFSVRDAVAPADLRGLESSLEGYGYVIWGTLGDASDVTIRYDRGTAKAAVLDVPAELARRFGQEPFALFVAELPLSAGCAALTVEDGKSSAKVKPNPAACDPDPDNPYSQDAYRP